MLPIERVLSSVQSELLASLSHRRHFLNSMVRNGLPSGVLKISVLNVIGLLLLALVSEPFSLRARSLGGSPRWPCSETREVTPKYKQYTSAP